VLRDRGAILDSSGETVPEIEALLRNSYPSIGAPLNERGLRAYNLNGINPVTNSCRVWLATCLRFRNSSM
jgi:hypothetical protein